MKRSPEINIQPHGPEEAKLEYLWAEKSESQGKASFSHMALKGQYENRSENPLSFLVQYLCFMVIIKNYTIFTIAYVNRKLSFQLGKSR